MRRAPAFCWTCPTAAWARCRWAAGRGVEGLQGGRRRRAPLRAPRRGGAAAVACWARGGRAGYGGSGCLCEAAEGWCSAELLRRAAGAAGTSARAACKEAASGGAFLQGLRRLAWGPHRLRLPSLQPPTPPCCVRCAPWQITLTAQDFGSYQRHSTADARTIVLKSLGLGRLGNDMYRTNFTDDSPLSFPQAVRAQGGWGGAAGLCGAGCAGQPARLRANPPPLTRPQRLEPGRCSLPPAASRAARKPLRCLHTRVITPGHRLPAPSACPQDASPFTGSYRPTQPLRFLFEGNDFTAGRGGSQGVWILQISDLGPKPEK